MFGFKDIKKSVFQTAVGMGFMKNRKCRIAPMGACILLSFPFLGRKKIKDTVYSGTKCIEKTL